MQHPDALRRAALARNPGAPWVTWYRLAPSDTDGCAVAARVELSNTTLDNWVAKTAGLLSEEFDVGPGTTVGLSLPLHWLLHVWSYGAWALGATVAHVGPEDDRDGLAVTIAAPGADGQLALQPADGPLLACGNDPMGLPLGAATPAGAIDALAEVRGYPDFFAFDDVAADAPVLNYGATVLTPALISAAPDSPDSLLAALLAGPSRGVPAVLVDIAPGADRDPERLRAALHLIAQQEGLGPPVEAGTNAAP
ncbi:MAG: TIGR03089 family protein [Candidatus Nanopelagicales bacterium]